MSEQQTNPLDIWMSEETPAPEPQQKPIASPMEKEELVAEEVEEVEQEEEESAEIDYDVEPPAPKEEEEEEETFANDTEAIKRAKIEGKQRKALEAEKKEWELERDRLQTELETYKTKSNELEAVRIKPEEHPDYIKERDSLQREIKDSFDDFDAPKKSSILYEFANYLGKYRQVDSAQDRSTQLENLKNELASKMFDDETATFDSLDKDDRKEVSAMLKLIKGSVVKADKLHELYDNLEKRSKTGTLALGVREYESLSKEYQPILDSIGDLPDDVIEANPHAIEARVALMTKDPEAKKRVDSAKRDVYEIINGVRPLSQAEIDKLEANGTDIKKFNAERNKALDEKRKRLLPLLIQGLVIRPEIKGAFSELATLKTKKASARSEEDALLKTTKKKAPSSKEEKVKNPVDTWFDEKR